MVSVTNYPGTVTAGTSSGSGVYATGSWTGLQNIGARDGIYAECVNHSGGIIVVFPTTDGYNPNMGNCSYGASACNSKDTNSDPNGYTGAWVEGSLGSSSDSWSIILTPNVVNSKSFGLVLWAPNAPTLILTNFGFSLPAGSVVNGMTVGYRWAAFMDPANGFATSQRIDYFNITIDYTPPGTQCSVGTTWCSGGHQYACPNGYNVDNGLNPTCPGTDCSSGQTECLNGHRYTCNNGYWDDAGADSTCPGTACTAGQTKCVNGHLYVCDNGYWSDQGLSDTCPGTDCSSGQTECLNGHLYGCKNGYWSDQGASELCPGSGCTGNVSHCVDGHKYACVNGTDTDQGADSTCCTPAGATQCFDGSRKTCNSDGSWSSGVTDSTCNPIPPVTNPAPMAALAIGALAIVGYLFMGGKR